MQYASTRSKHTTINSVSALLNGIAPDGGLYIPHEFPAPILIEKNASFNTVLSQLLGVFFDDVPLKIRQQALRAFTSQFPNPPIPIQTTPNGAFLELFHGPTGAFKDVALTILPHLLQYAAQQHQQEKVLILTATSGDTGSAALSGFSNVKNTEVLVFYPTIGTSQIQEAQMLLKRGDNVRAFAINGNFDDAQRGVKQLFTDPKVRTKAKEQGIFLSSANSINIGRLFPQIAYYLYAAKNAKEPLNVVVPTGNFGNILAAYYAKKLGAHIGTLVVASNENCAVSEFIRTGHYNANRDFKITRAPSMDILVSSNIERLLYDLAQGDVERVQTLLESLKTRGEMTLNESEFTRLKLNFTSEQADDLMMQKAILNVYKNEHYLMDPHTAIGYAVAEKLNMCNAQTLIVATASPWKFPSTLLHALGFKPEKDDFKNLLKLQEVIHEQARFAELAEMAFHTKREIQINDLSSTII